MYCKLAVLFEMIVLHTIIDLQLHALLVATELIKSACQLQQGLPDRAIDCMQCYPHKTPLEADIIAHISNSGYWPSPD